jgi:hypothetical protein
MRLLLPLIVLTLIRFEIVSAQPNARQVDMEWQQMLPAVRDAIKNVSVVHADFAGINDRAIRIDTTVDITGDDVPEALVYLGGGGASTDEFTVIRIEAHKPVIAAFRNRNGKTSAMVFFQGSSVMHSDAVQLVAEQHAVYAFHFKYGPTGKLSECGGEAYVWNDHSKTFDYSSHVSTTLTRRNCRQVPQTVR